MNIVFTVPALPIFWRESKIMSNHSAIPDAMDLSLSVAEEWGGVVAVVTTEMKAVLNLIYLEDENIGYLQDDNPLAGVYGPEFVDFVAALLPAKSEVCEIGAGGCYTLRKLRGLGHEVSGIDPSPIAAAAGQQYGITIVSEFFPVAGPQSGQIYDAFIHYDVLEHMEDPLNFLKQIYASLAVGGRTLFVVPDCTEHIRNQDISMCIHQHLNYFTLKSLAALAAIAGFGVEFLKQSNTTGTILCSLIKNKEGPASEAEAGRAVGDAKEEAIGFHSGLENKYKDTVNVLRSLLEKSVRGVAFYAPLRAIPFIAPLLKDFSDRILFVDDNEKVQGTYICDINIPIRSRSSALEAGIQDYVICSRPFRGKMVDKLEQDSNCSTLNINFL